MKVRRKTLRFLKKLGRGIGYFVIGAVADFFVVLYYRSVTHGSDISAMVTAFILAVLPILVTERGISTKSRWVYFFYAAGTSLGTYLGMHIRV